MRKKIIVVGGGASGLTAAIFAARQGADVAILERMARVGKKLLSTGNGKCNMTNLDMRAECYHSSLPSFPMQVIGRFGVKETLSFFRELGIVTKGKNGYIYPASEQASSVLDALRMEAQRLGVAVECDCRVERIIPNANGQIDGVRRGDHRPGFTVEVSVGQAGEGKEKPSVHREKRRADRVILAAGSKAAPSTGSDGGGYLLAKSLGHKILTPLPALVQLRCREKWLKSVSGVRADAYITLSADGKKAQQVRGELQLTDYGISGIPVFQISGMASRALEQKKQVEVSMDFCPDMEADQLADFLWERRDALSYRTADGFLTGFFNKKLAGLFLKLSGVSLSDQVSGMDKKDIYSLTAVIKGLKVSVESHNHFENAQVCCGGADPSQVEPSTMESRLVSGLYLAGELLDVDGICGGYNLQWAWSTGALAGMEAGRDD